MQQQVEESEREKQKLTEQEEQEKKIRDELRYWRKRELERDQRIDVFSLLTEHGKQKVQNFKRLRKGNQ